MSERFEDIVPKPSFGEIEIKTDYLEPGQQSINVLGIGCVELLQSETPGRWSIWGLTIYPDSDRKHVETSLVDLAIEEAKSTGATEIGIPFYSAALFKHLVQQYGMSKISFDQYNTDSGEYEHIDSHPLHVARLLVSYREIMRQVYGQSDPQYASSPMQMVLELDNVY